MRASRLVALLLHVQRHGGSSTAPELARHLEVSVRTIYRDIAALQEAGVPLWTEPGPFGGVRLVEGWHFPLDGLSSDETAALLVGGAGAADLGLGTVLVAAQSKVLTALPPELRARAARIRERFLLDAPGWFHRPEATPQLATVAEGVWSARRLDLTYRAGEAAVARVVDPLGLVLKAGTWYLVASVEGSLRTYRVSRIDAAAVRAEPVARPDGFVLTTWWAASSEEFDRAIRPLAVRLRLDAGAARRLRSAVPGPMTDAALADAGPPDDLGRVELSLPMESVAVAVGQLAGLGAVEVVEPLELRLALRSRGRELASLNG